VRVDVVVAITKARWTGDSPFLNTDISTSSTIYLYNRATGEQLYKWPVSIMMGIWDSTKESMLTYSSALVHRIVNDDPNEVDDHYLFFTTYHFCKKTNPPKLEGYLTRYEICKNQNMIKPIYEEKYKYFSYQGALWRDEVSYSSPSWVQYVTEDDLFVDDYAIVCVGSMYSSQGDFVMARWDNFGQVEVDNLGGAETEKDIKFSTPMVSYYTPPNWDCTAIYIGTDREDATHPPRIYLITIDTVDIQSWGWPPSSDSTSYDLDKDYTTSPAIDQDLSIYITSVDSDLDSTKIYMLENPFDNQGAFSTFDTETASHEAYDMLPASVITTQKDVYLPMAAL
jgi:hypothetical protein